MLASKMFEFLHSSFRLLTATITKMFRNTVMGIAINLVVIEIYKALVSSKFHVYTVLAGQKNTVGYSTESTNRAKSVLLESITTPINLALEEDRDDYLRKCKYSLTRLASNHSVFHFSSLSQSFLLYASTEVNVFSCYDQLKWVSKWQMFRFYLSRKFKDKFRHKKIWRVWK